MRLLLDFVWGLLATGSLALMGCNPSLGCVNLPDCEPQLVKTGDYVAEPGSFVPDPGHEGIDDALVDVKTDQVTIAYPFMDEGGESSEILVVYRVVDRPTD